jgi:zinc and cadmium transporter
MDLLWILAGTVVAGVGSVWIAALLSFGIMARFTRHMLSFAAGALLATAFLKLLPEAIETGISSHLLFGVLLAALVFFFMLDKAELYHHGHEHGDLGMDLHGAAHSEPAAAGAAALSAAGNASQASLQTAQHKHQSLNAHRHHHHHSGGWAVIVGDSVHAFGDGILIAAAFMADWRLGWIASMAVLAHEVPHHMGDLVVLQHTSKNNAKAALLKVSLAGAVTALGGIVGYFLLAQFVYVLPFFLVVAASSFMYVALADLIPQLQRHVSLRDSAGQLLWLAAGIALVLLVGEFSHHSHTH